MTAAPTSAAAVVTAALTAAADIGTIDAIEASSLGG
jgi:hypothetical protein